MLNAPKKPRVRLHNGKHSKLNNQKGYRAQIKILGVRESKVFTTRRGASERVAAREIFIRWLTHSHADGAAPAANSHPQQKKGEG